MHAKIELLFGDKFTESDASARAGRGGEPAWKNNVDSVYDDLKRRGELRASRRGDAWTLASYSGVDLEENFPDRLRPVDSAAGTYDGLIDFKPKSASAYVSQLRSQTLLKRRDHERTLREYGLAVHSNGWRVSTDVHPRDLELRRGTATCVVEVKQVYERNPTTQVREAVAQLLEYSYYFYPDMRVDLVKVAVFSESIGDSHSDYLASLGIAAVWRISHRAWEGNAVAQDRGVVPRS